MENLTAVEWLILEMNKTGFIFDKIDLMAFEQSKEMEKKQIINAYETAMETDVYNEPLKTGEQYYNQTFKN
jgi:hypothetical protein